MSRYANSKWHGYTSLHVYLIYLSKYTDVRRTLACRPRGPARLERILHFVPTAFSSGFAAAILPRQYGRLELSWNVPHGKASLWHTFMRRWHFVHVGMFKNSFFSYFCGYLMKLLHTTFGSIPTRRGEAIRVYKFWIYYIEPNLVCFFLANLTILSNGRKNLKKRDIFAQP